MRRTSSYNDKYYLTSVGHALDVLGSLSDSGEAGLTEIVNELGLSKTSVFRLLYTLKSKGFVRQDSSTNRYRLGYRVFAMGTLVRDQDLLGEQLTPFLEDLAEQSGETANIGVAEGSEVVHVNAVVSPQALRTDIKIGEREPLHSTALGKILIAHSSWNEVLARLGSLPLRRLTPSTITSLEKLKAELQLICRQGYALDNEETYLGIRCIAVPISDGTGRAVAALSISAPVSRFPLAKMPSYLELLTGTSSAIQTFLQMNLPSEPRPGSDRPPNGFVRHDSTP